MYREGGIIGKSNTPTSTSASGTWRINEVHNAVQTNSFPVFVETSITAGLDTITPVPINIRYIAGNDDSNPFDVVDVNFTSASSGTHRMHIGCIPRPPTVYYNDLCIGVFQVIKASDNSLVTSKGGNDYANMGTSFGPQNPTTNPDTLSGVFAGLGFGSNVQRWNIASGTGSTNSGATDGISVSYSGTTLLPSPGFGVVPQVNGTYYFYCETSSSPMLNNIHWLVHSGTEGALSLTANTDYIFRIAYHYATASSQSGALYNNIMYVYIDN